MAEYEYFAHMYHIYYRVERRVLVDWNLRAHRLVCRRRHCNHTANDLASTTFWILEVFVVSDKPRTRTDSDSWLFLFAHCGYSSSGWFTQLLPPWDHPFSNIYLNLTIIKFRFPNIPQIKLVLEINVTSIRADKYFICLQSQYIWVSLNPVCLPNRDARLSTWRPVQVSCMCSTPAPVLATDCLFLNESVAHQMHISRHATL